MKRAFEALKAWALRLRRNVMVLWFACRDPATPWFAKLLATLVAAYALSPIDLIPDFIPVIGWLDELLLLPALIWLVLRLLPEPVRVRARDRADDWLALRRARPRSHLGAVAIIVIWLLALGGLAWWFFASSA